MQQQQQQARQKRRRIPLWVWMIMSACFLIGIVIIIFSIFLTMTQGVDRGASIFTIIVGALALLMPLVGWMIQLFKHHQKVADATHTPPSLPDALDTRSHVSRASAPLQEMSSAHRGAVAEDEHALANTDASHLENTSHRVPDRPHDQQTVILPHPQPTPLQHVLPSAQHMHEDHTVSEYFQVPFRRNPFFLGREDVLQRLHDEVQRGRPLGLPIAVSGLGGMGKTQLVLEYAYRYRHLYQAVFWVRADERETLLIDIIHLAYGLHLPEKDDQDQERVLEAVKHWLMMHAGWLLVLDNVEDLEVLNMCLPPLHDGSVLLTTRTSTTAPLAQGFELEPLDEKEASCFFLRRAGLLQRDAPLDAASADDLHHARTLVHLLGGLPLALDQAGAYILETGCGSASYLQLYHHQQRYLLQRRGTFFSEHPASVAATILLAFEQVTRLNPTAAALLQFCAFLHPDAIAEEIIVKGAAQLEPPLQTLATDALAFNEAIETLRHYSLLRRNPITKTLTIHRLIQLVLQNTMSFENTRYWVEQVMKAIHTVMPYYDTAWPAIMRYIPHILLCADYLKNVFSPSLEAVHILRRAGRYLEDHLQLDQAELLLQQAYTMCNQLLGSQHFETLRCFYSVAIIHDNRGEYEKAMELYKQILEATEASKEVIPNPPLSAILYSLAGNYLREGRYEKAEPLVLRALALSEEALGDHRAGYPEEAIRELVVVCLELLGKLRREQGRNEEAESLLHRSLMLCRQSKVLRREKNEARALFELANVEEQQGNMKTAEQHFLESLAFAEQHDMLSISERALALAKLFIRQGVDEKAEPLLQRALTLRERQYGHTHAETREVLHVYLALLRKTGREEIATHIEEQWR